MKSKAFCKWVSLLMGASATFPGASLFNVSEDFRTIIFPNIKDLLSLVLAIYFSIVSISAFFFTYYTVDKRHFLFTGLIGNTVAAALLPLVCFVSSEMLGATVLCVITGFLGLFISLSLTSAIGLGANDTDVDIGSFAAGFGFSGCMSFGVWMFFAYVVYNKKTKASVSLSITSLFLFSVVFSCFVISLYLILLKRNRLTCSQDRTLEKDESVSVKFLEAQQSEKDTQSQTSTISLLVNDGTYIEIIKKASILLFLRFFGFYETYIIFPSIGPKLWKPTRINGSILVGVFQIVDFLGRYFPVYFPNFILTQSQLVFGCFPKGAIVILCCVACQHATSFPWNFLPFQILLISLMAFSNGWFTSSTTIRLPQRFISRKGKSASSALGLCLAFVGIALGMWSSIILGKTVT